MRIKKMMPRWFQRMIVGWAKAFDPRYMAVSSTGTYGRGLSPGKNLTGQVRSIEYNIWAYICIKKIAESISGLPLKFYTGQGKKKKEVFDDPIANMIYRPNPFSTHRSLWISTTWFLLLTGNAYWSIDEMSPAKKPVKGKTKIWTLPADKVKIIPDKKEYIAGYLVGGDTGKQVRFDVNEIVHFKQFNPSDTYYGLSPLTVAEQNVETDFYARDFNRRFFKNDASVGKELKTDQPYNKEADDRIKTQWKADHQGYDKSNRMELYWAGLEPIPDIRNPKDMDFLNLIKLDREEIISMYGTPPAVVGLFEYIHYANAMMQKMIFWEETLIPLLMHYETTMNELEIPKWTDKDLWMKFDLSNVAALQEDEFKKSIKVTRLVGGGVYTPNEARDEFYDLEPIDGGDELILPVKAPFGGVPAKGITIKAYDSRIEKWLKKDASRSRHESGFLPVMNRYFDKQKDRILKALAEFTDEFYPTGEEIAMIFNEAKEKELLLKDTNLTIIKAFKEAGKVAFEEVQGMKSVTKQEGEIAGAFDLTDPEVIAFLEQHGAQFVTYVTTSTKKKIAVLLDKAYKEGMPIRELAKELTGMFEGFSKKRSLTIAQTEMGNCMNAGTFEGYKQAGADKKAWLATPDMRVRPTHAEAGAQLPIPINQAFRVGASLMMHPNDPAGGVEEIVNCRCSLYPVVSEAEE